jgi:PAS domain S-box-containing protein
VGIGPGHLSVLLIEDDEDDYLILLRMFEEVRGRKYRVDWADSFQAGLEAVRRCEHDVYLLDHRMGERSGIELLETVFAEGCAAPVIFLTACGDYDLDVRAMRAGASDYLVKGQFTPQLLERSIRYAIERKKVEDELRRHREDLERLVEERTVQHAEARADAEQRAHEAEEARSTLEALLEHSPVGLAIADAPDLRIRAVSKYGLELEMLAGSPLEKAKGRRRPKWSAFRPGEERPAPPEEVPLVRAARGGEVIRNEEWELAGQEGERVPVLCSAGPIRDRDGHVTGGIMVWREIGELKAAQQQLLEAHCALEERVAERTSELAEALRSLRESEGHLQILARQLLKAQEEERRRLSREIHDSIGSSLSAVKLCIESLGQHVRAGTDTPELAAHMASVLEAAIEEARRIMTDLRPSILDDLGIVVTIDWLCRRHRTFHPDAAVEKHIEVEESAVPEHLKITIFRILQEAMANIAKYSKAGRVSVSLADNNGSIDLQVEDDGVGFDPGALERGDIPRGYGLVGMKERAELSGGAFHVESRRGAGTKVRASWPADPRE